MPRECILPAGKGDGVKNVKLQEEILVNIRKLEKNSSRFDYTSVSQQETDVLGGHITSSWFRGSGPARMAPKAVKSGDKYLQAKVTTH